jgi:hypothetical protein
MRLPASTFAAALLSLLACSAAQTLPKEGTPGLVVPVAIAEGSGDGKSAPAAPSARAAQPAASAAPNTAPGSAPPASAAGSAEAVAPLPLDSAPPDPEALRTADQLEYTLVYENGGTRVASVRRLRLERPVVTARRMGRFAVELWVGRELLDRVRFDFPLLAAEEEPREGARRPLYETQALTRGPVSVTVLVPYTERARRAVLVDRATGRLTELTWPPGQ